MDRLPLLVMNLFSNIVSFFQRPFPPTENWRNRLIVAIAVAMFVTFFLYIFEPFGLSYVKQNKFWICLGFGFTTLVASVLFEITVVMGLKLYEDSRRYTLGIWILQAIGLIMTISVANFLFGRWLHGNMDWSVFPQMIYATFAIGVFPTVVLGSLAMLRQERKYQKIALDINSHKVPKEVTAAIEKQTLGDIAINNIRYLESYQNYVKIGHVDQDAALKEEIQRATLKSYIELLEGTNIVKCHRSYLVNKDAIISVSGNAQGLLLSLQDCDREIPVSRSFVPVFR